MNNCELKPAAVTQQLKRILYRLTIARAGGADSGDVIDQAQQQNGSYGTSRALLVEASLSVPVDLEREEKECRLMKAVDKLNLWGGRGTVRAASLGEGAKPQGWQMRREHKTPCYTTRIEDVPRVMI